jgi:hypothetical protein
MKKTILALAVLLMAITAFAQDNNEKPFRSPSGYQGFFETGSAYGLAYNLSLVNSQLSTTHGYQFTDKFFGGIGAGVNVSLNHPTVIPFYGAFHYIFTTNKVSPVVRARGGAYFVPNSRVNLTPQMTSKDNGFGAYGDIGFGVRFATNSSIAFNLMAVATYYSDITVTHYQINLMGMGASGYYYDTRENISNISLVFSLEW